MQINECGLNEKALEAAIATVEAMGCVHFGAEIEAAIRAYLEAATPPDVAGLVAELQAEIEEQRVYGEPIDRLVVERGISALLSAGGGWRTMDSAPQGPAILLDLGETIPDLVDARVGQYVTEVEAAKLGETLSASGGWIIWNSGDDWFVVPFDEAHGWQPLPLPPASPTVEAGR